MFTGIVEQVGEVFGVEDTGDSVRMTLGNLDTSELKVGASLAVDGVCLTAVELNGDTVAVDVIPETLSRSSLGLLEEGHTVNIEFAMRADGRFDGHIVQGHVDGTGVISDIVRGEDGSTVFSVSADPELLKYVVPKGSITLSGISLTVVDTSDTGFRVALIPHTLEVTTLGSSEPGDLVNLETDVLAKYVERLVGS